MNDTGRNTQDKSVVYVDYRSRTDFTTSDVGSDSGSRPIDYLYSKDSNDTLHLTRVPAILQLSSNFVGSCPKRGYTRKHANPLVPELPTITVPTNHREKHDQLILLDLKLQPSRDIRKKQKELTATVAEYVGDTESSYNFNVMRRLSTGHWKRKIDRSYESSIMEKDPMETSRVDYLDPFTVSIDPDGCSDVDDALSIHEIDGGYQIGIHIADPTSYIIEDSDLDLEAMIRSESVYLQEAIHMYPSDLTTQVFSLRATHDSRAFSVVFDVKDGEISNVQILKTLIRVDSNETYDNFEQTYEDSPLKRQLYDIGKLIHRQYISPIDRLYDSKKMVQGFMVYANTVVATHLVRVAGSDPSFNRIILRSQPVVGDTLGSSDSDKSFLSEVSPEIIEMHSRLRWSSAILKVWTDDSTDRHFGVGQDLYTHFTSPIRRYSDVLIHRLLWNSLTDGEFRFKLTPLSDLEYLRTLFILNHNKKFYRRMAMFERDWKIRDMAMSLGCDTPLEFKGRIVSIDSNSLRVMITGPVSDEENLVDFSSLFEQFDRMVIRTELMSKKMIESFEASETTSPALQFEISDDSDVNLAVHTYDGQTYRLFDKIHILVVFSKGVRRYRAYLPT